MAPGGRKTAEITAELLEFLPNIVVNLKSRPPSKHHPYLYNLSNCAHLLLPLLFCSAFYQRDVDFEAFVILDETTASNKRMYFCVLGKCLNSK